MPKTLSSSELSLLWPPNFSLATQGHCQTCINRQEMWKFLDCSMLGEQAGFYDWGYQKPQLETFNEGMLCSGSVGGRGGGWITHFI